MAIRPLLRSGILATCMVLGGCAASVGTSPEWSSPAATYLGPITARIEYETAGIFLDVPASVDVGVSWSYAYSSNCPGEAVCHLDRGPTIVLAEATSTSPAEVQGDGSLKPLMQKTLVYVIKWTEVPCAPLGPMVDGRSASPPAIYSCTALTFVDALSGTVLFSVEGTNL